MSKLVASRKPAQILALTALVALAVLLLDACRAKPAPASAPAPETVAAAPAAPAPAPAAQRSKEEAMTALMNLPELKAWSAQLEKDSHGKVHGALIEYDPAPKVIAGKAYWQFSFVENGSDAAHRWESFLVAQSGDEILIDDDGAGKTLTLAQWRAQRHPMQRTSADVIGG